MKILITGGNSDLAKFIGKSMSAFGFEILIVSSKNISDSSKFDLNLGYSSKILENIGCVIHCAANPKNIFTEIEENFISETLSKNIKFIYIGSTSSYIENKNKYGNYKKSVEEYILNKGGLSITCGLIFGDNFAGQINQIKSYLSKIPISIQLKDSKYSYLTPIESIPAAIIQLLSNVSMEGKRINLFHPQKVEFNKLLRVLSGNKLLSLSIQVRFLLKFFSLIPINHRYFNLDRLKGIMSSFTPDLLETAVDLTDLVELRFTDSFLLNLTSD